MPAARSPFVWREPTAAIPLRWGAYRSRLIGGLWLIVAGGVAIAGGSAFSVFAQFLLSAGTVAHVLGWAVLPATGWRRVWAMWPSTLAMWFLLTGPRWVAILVLAYLGWLLVRHRPLAAYPTAVFVLAGAVSAPFGRMVIVSAAATWTARAGSAQFRGHKSASRVWESNPRPHDYKSSALPTELTRRDLGKWQRTTLDTTYGETRPTPEPRQGV